MMSDSSGAEPISSRMRASSARASRRVPWAFPLRFTPSRRTTALYLPEGNFWIDIDRIVSRVSRTVNGGQPFTSSDLVGDGGLDPPTSTV